MKYNGEMLTSEDAFQFKFWLDQNYQFNLTTYSTFDSDFKNYDLKPIMYDFEF